MIILKKRNKANKILEAKFEASSILEARPTFGLKPKQGPTLRPGQLWGQARPIGPGQVLQYASLMIKQLKITLMVCKSFPFYENILLLVYHYLVTRLNMAEILPIWRKMLSNQSINRSINQSTNNVIHQIHQTTPMQFEYCLIIHQQ